MTGYYFISHASQDKAEADRLVASLEEHGVRCWIAPRDIAAGRVWATAIDEAIRKSDGFIILISRHANNSNFIHGEITLAANNKKSIFPVFVEQIQPADEIQLFVAHIQSIPLKLATAKIVSILVENKNLKIEPKLEAKSKIKFHEQTLPFASIIFFCLVVWLFIDNTAPKTIRPRLTDTSPSFDARRGVDVRPVFDASTSREDAISGWLVRAYDQRFNAGADFSSHPFMMFKHDSNLFSSNLNIGHFSASNKFSYRADALLKIIVGGRHSFVVKLISEIVDPDKTAACEVALNVNKQDVVKYAFVNLPDSTVAQGVVDLNAGKYPIVFWLECNVQAYERSKFLIMVRSPEDSSPRTLQKDEIFHYN